MKSQRLFAALICFVLTFALAACVGSERPLLADAEAIADAALAGEWTYPDGDNLRRMSVAARGKTFLITNPAEPATKPVVATLHPFDAQRLILQMRSDDGRVTQYALVARDTTKAGRAWLMLADICNREIADAAGLKAIKADRFSCMVAAREQLTALLRRAAAGFGKDEKKLLRLTQSDKS